MEKREEKIVNADTPEGQLLGETMIEAIEEQLADNDPAEVKRTLDRLMKMGQTRENAMRYIANAFAVELFEALKGGSPYDEERYVRNLKRLPTLPDE